MSGQFYIMIGQDDWKHLTSTSCIIFSIVLSVNKILITYEQMICKNLSDQKEDFEKFWENIILCPVDKEKLFPALVNDQEYSVTYCEKTWWR